MDQGCLYVVATPIGNMKDMTFRAVEVLGAVDGVICEDTRRTGRLLSHYGLSVKLSSFFAGNESRRLEGFLEKLSSGRKLALVTDAGTPAVSDPGYMLIRECRSRGIPVVPVPGPSAAVAALSVSGLPSDRMLFLGFPPRKPGQSRTFLTNLAQDPAALVFYEAPHRIRRFMADARRLLPGRECFVGREITKLHESFYLNPEPENLPEKGEFVIVFGPPEKSPASRPSDAEIAEKVRALTGEGCDEREAMRTVARELGVAKRDIYELIKGKGKRGAGAAGVPIPAKKGSRR